MSRIGRRAVNSTLVTKSLPHPQIWPGAPHSCETILQRGCRVACSGSQSHVRIRRASSHTLHIEHGKNAHEYKTRFIIVFRQMGEWSAAPLCKMELYISFYSVLHSPCPHKSGDLLHIAWYRK